MLMSPVPGFSYWSVEFLAVCILSVDFQSRTLTEHKKKIVVVFHSTLAKIVH